MPCPEFGEFEGSGTPVAAECERRGFQQGLDQADRWIARLDAVAVGERAGGANAAGATAGIGVGQGKRLRAVQMGAEHRITRVNF